MSFATWSVLGGRLQTVGASDHELAAIQAAYNAMPPSSQGALDTLTAGLANGDLLVMLNTWRTSGSPFEAGFPGGGLPFGTGVAVLTGSPGDDAYPVSAGTGQKMTSVMRGQPTGGAIAWATGIAFLPNQLVTNGGTTYICITAHTAGASFDASKFQAIGGGGGGGVTSFNTRTGAVAPGTADYLAVASGGLTGATAATRYVGGTASGAPSSGTFAKGDFVVDQTGQLWVCTTAGTPGTWKTLQINGFFDVTAYGAVADSNGTTGNGTDNKTAFVNAVAAAVANGGGVVWIPPAGLQYRIAAKNLLVGASNVHVLGAGAGASTIFFDTADTLTSTFGRLLFDGAASAGLSSPLSTGAPITSLPITALTKAVTAGTVFTLTDLAQAHTQTWTVSANTAAGATSLPVNSQTPNFAYAVGSALVSNTGTITDVSCRNLTVTGIPGQIVPISSGSGFNGCCSGITFRACVGFVCDGVETNQPANYSILALRCTNGSITNNHCHDSNRDGIHVMDGCTDISIVTNHVHDTADDCIAVGYNGPNIATNNDGIIVTGNTVYNSGSRGIAVMSPASNVTIQGNKVAWTHLAGIHVGWGVLGGVNQVVVAANVIENAGRFSVANETGTGFVPCGISLESNTIQQVTIVGNMINNSQCVGIYANASVNALVISGNVIDMGFPSQFTGTVDAGQTDPGRYPGIYLRGTASATIVGNTVGNCFHEGILANSGNGEAIMCIGNIIRTPNSANAATTNAITISSGPGFALGNAVVAGGHATQDVSITTPVGTWAPPPITAPVYSASITPDASLGRWQPITVTNGTAFTINAPTNPPTSSQTEELTVEIFNSSGGAMGAITWNAAFVLVGGAFTNPATGKHRFIRFEWNGTSWIETGRASADY